MCLFRIKGGRYKLVYIKILREKLTTTPKCIQSQSLKFGQNMITQKQRDREKHVASNLNLYDGYIIQESLVFLS